jgi:hypothetical protein
MSRRGVPRSAGRSSIPERPPSQAWALTRPLATLATKRVLRQRLFLVREQTMVKNRIGALLSQHTVQRPAVSDLYVKEGMVWLRHLTLPDPDGRVLAEDIKLLEVLRDQIVSANGLLKKLAAGDEACHLFREMR